MVVNWTAGILAGGIGVYIAMYSYSFAIHFNNAAFHFSVFFARLTHYSGFISWLCKLSIRLYGSFYNSRTVGAFNTNHNKYEIECQTLKITRTFTIFNRFYNQIWTNFPAIQVTIEKNWSHLKRLTEKIYWTPSIINCILLTRL